MQIINSLKKYMRVNMLNGWAYTPRLACKICVCPIKKSRKHLEKDKEEKREKSGRKIHLTYDLFEHLLHRPTVAQPKIIPPQRYTLCAVGLLLYYPSVYYTRIRAIPTVCTLVIFLSITHSNALFVCR